MTPEQKQEIIETVGLPSNFNFDTIYDDYIIQVTGSHIDNFDDVRLCSGLKTDSVLNISWQFKTNQ